jgi:hypothetical protein
MAKIQWTNETRKLADLVPWDQNPRQIRKDQADRLAKSMKNFAQIETIAIGPNNELYNGHQRLKVWQKEFGNIDVAVRVASRKLTEKEKRTLTIYLHNTATGELDWDMLSSWDTNELIELGMDQKLLDQLDHDSANLRDLLNSGDPLDSDGDPMYSDAILSPVYEPAAECPKIDELADFSKTLALAQEINESGLDEEIGGFLKAAASRHTVFNYDKIADYYAQASPEVQKLMEKSALVIIDFDQAIENGFVRLTDRMKDLFAHASE